MPANPEELCDRYLNSVYQYIRRRVQSREDAEDLTSETMSVAFAQLSHFRGDCPVEYWLFGIARRQIAMLHRRFRIRREVPLQLNIQAVEAADSSAHSADPVGCALLDERFQVMRRLIASLKADYREVLLLKYREGFSVEEIAAILGRSPTTVSGLLQRARAAVRERGRGYFLDCE